MTTTPASTDEPIAVTLGRFAEKLSYDDLPPEVLDQARLLLLDSLGIAVASTRYGFAGMAAEAVSDLVDGAPGQASAVGCRDTLPLRDAALLNGLLVHGLDFDDTHPGGVLHASASTLATALAVSERRGLTGRDLLTAYVIGIEVAARLGLAARGGFHQVGFHPTGLVGAYASTLVAGRLEGLDAEGLARAQGFVDSLAAGSLEFLSTGAWTKRAHPGWAAVCAITATSFARTGFVTPERPYEGRFGLYARHLGDRPIEIEMARLDLGEVWETMAVAVKPYPACHFTHAFADAAIALRERHGLRASDVASMRCLIAEGEVGAVCEPAEAKRRPRSSYDAQFSLPFVTATALVRGRFTLAEIEEDARSDREVLDLVDRTTYEVDPDSGFPELFSGEVVVTTTDGRELRHREHVNRGAGPRPLTREDIMQKFRGTAGLALDESRVQDLADAVLGLDRAEDLARLTTLLRAV